MPPGFQEWAESVSLWQIIGWSAGLVGLFVFGRLFIKKGWPATKKFATAILNFAQIIDSVQELPAFIERTDKSIKTMRSQLENSHVTNLRDDVTAAIDGIKSVENKVDGVASDLAEAKATLTASDAEIRRDLLESGGRVRQDLEDRRAVEDTRNEEEQHD